MAEEDRYDSGELLLIDPATFIHTPFFAELDATYYEKENIHNTNPASFIHDKIEVDGSPIPYDDVRYHTLLAKYIPAKTFGLGGEIGLEIAEVLLKQKEMQNDFNSGWFYPVDANLKYWNHGDFKTVPFIFTHKLYRYILDPNGSGI